MREYQFEYTKTKGTLIALLICVFLFFVIGYVIVRLLQMQEIMLFVIELIAMIFVFQLLKKNTYGTCIAKIKDNEVEFNFEQTSRVIKFNELVSFKASYGRSVTILYLKDNVDKFRMYANNFCDRKSFNALCEDLINQIDRYGIIDNDTIIEQGIVFTKKSLGYILIIATSIYLLGFLFEGSELKLYLGIGGGLYLSLMWISYLNKRKTSSKQTGS